MICAECQRESGGTYHCDGRNLCDPCYENLLRHRTVDAHRYDGHIDQMYNLERERTNPKRRKLK